MFSRRAHLGRIVHSLGHRVLSSQSMSLDYSQARAAVLHENINSVLDEIAAAADASARPRLVPVSKLKPATDIKALYDAGHRHFGENYIQEMIDKSQVLPDDIQWHFIGALQSNKAKSISAIPNLYMLETLSSIKVANLLQKSLPTTRTAPLNVYLQVNTSGEDAKSGLPPLTLSSTMTEPLVELAIHVLTRCPSLHLSGLMTIGSWDGSHDADRPNPDFSRLKETRHELFRLLGELGASDGPKNASDLELSMGMSSDFVQAVREGSSSVRVGTKIFGERPKKTQDA